MSYRYSQKVKFGVIGLFMLFMNASCMNKQDKVEEFWSWFEENKSEFEHLDDDNRDAKLDEILLYLDQIAEGLAVEVSDEFNGVRDIVISANGNKELFSTVKDIVKRAPKIKGWTVTAFRQPAKEDFTLKFKDLSFTPSKMYFEPKSEGNMLHLNVYVNNAKQHAKDSVDHYGSIAMDNVLGEYDAAAKVSSYSFLNYAILRIERI